MTGTRLKQEQKFLIYKEGKSKGGDLQIDNIPKLGEKLLLMGYKDEMVCWELKALRTVRMKFVLFVTAGIGEREGTENLVNLKKESVKITQ